MKTKTPFIPSSLHSESLGSRYLIPFFLLLFITSFLVSSSLLAQVPAYVPTNGLVGYWPFNGNANDESGNGNHGTVNGATLTTDRNGNANSAYSFDGVDDYIDIGEDKCHGLNQLSVSAWIKIDDLNGGYIISTGNLNEYSIGINNTGQLLGETDYLPTQTGSSNFQTHSISSPGNNNNTWRFIALVWDGFSNKLLLDGILVDSVTAIAPLLITHETQYLTFGAYYWSNANGIYFEPSLMLMGTLDDIAIYNRALTQEEITALYNGTTTISGCTNNTACNYNAAATQDDGSCTYPAQTYFNCAGTCINDADNDGTCDELETPTLPPYLPSNGLVGYWPFNGNANDESGNGNHGTVNGATLTADRNGNANSAYRFNGSANIAINNNEIFNLQNTNFSISSWFYCESENLFFIINKSIGGGPTLKWIYQVATNGYVGGGLIGMTVSNNQGENFFYQPNSVIKNNWYHYVAIREGNEIRYFLNGVLIYSQNTEVIFPTTNATLFFGSDEGGLQGGYSLLGNLDDIAIYNRALTQEEITALYNGTTSGGGGGNGGTAGTPAPSVPQGIPYQAMIRDNNGAALINTPVTVRFSLRQDAIDGTVEYQETHNLTTNAFGLVNTHFGSGSATQGTFAGINWSNTTKFIQVEANSGSGFVEMGTQQMMSVPFALKANDANKATKIQNAGLPVYANNAAALAGGLVSGEMYRTATGDLKIVY